MREALQMTMTEKKTERMNCIVLYIMFYRQGVVYDCLSVGVVNVLLWCIV